MPLPPHERNKVIAKLAGVLVLVGILCAGALMPFVGGAGLLAKTQSDKFLTTTCSLQETQPPQQTVFYANDGKTPLATLFLQDRKPVSLSQIPKYLQQALVATEDRRFYSHTGVDMRGLLRSAFTTSSGETQGGSTLTMQYVKQVRYYQAATTATDAESQKQSEAAQEAAISQNINRKIEDANCAIYLESGKKETKDQILTNYLNIAFFGENSYSVQAAAETYFGKDVSALSLPQSAMLVGALKAPTQYDPFQHPETAMKRRNQVIDNLAAVGDISQADADKYKTEPMGLTTTKTTLAHSDCTSASITNAGFFCDYLYRWLIQNNGITDHSLFTGGLKVVTTLDANLQQSAQAALTKAFPWDPKSASAFLPVVDPKTGNILAMVSNRTFGNDASAGQTSFQYFDTASANAASTFKYFTMIAALKAGAPTNMVLATPDGPYVPESCRGIGPGKGFNDSSKSIPSTLSMTEAFAQSSNKYFLGIEDKFFHGCDLVPVVNTAADLGITYLNDKANSSSKSKSRLTKGQDIINQSEFSFTLGGEASPLQMASAYGIAANDGVYCPPSPVLSITDGDGNSMSVKRGSCVPKFSAQVARNALTVMSGESKGAGTAAPAFAAYYADGGSPVAGKTGTGDFAGTAKNSTAWYVGTTPTMSGAIAIFNSDGFSNPIMHVPGVPDGAASGADAARMWVAALGSTLKQTKWTWPPANILAQGVTVPNVVGLTPPAASAKLTAAGFKVQIYGDSYKSTGDAPDTALQCAPVNTIPANSVAYQSPSGIAMPGSTITVCYSSGPKLTAVVATPKPSPKPSTKPSPPGARPTPRPGG